MATKRFTGETELHIEILDGPAAGEYTVDIGKHSAACREAEAEVRG